MSAAEQHPAPAIPAGQPQHPLDYWASPDLARISPPRARSRLRELADTQGARAAAWSAAISGGCVLALAGAATFVLTGSVGWLLFLAGSGAALTTLGLLSWRKVRASLPDTARNVTARGPGSLRSAAYTALGFAAVIGAGFATLMPGAATKGTLPALVAAYLVLVALLAAWIIVPSAVMGRARESFRRRLSTNPTLRAAVEADLTTWRDPHGNATYGPL